MGKTCHIYLGANTSQSSRGIYHAELDIDTGVISRPELAIELNSPAYFAATRDGRRMYTTGPSSVTALDIEPDSGQLRVIGSQDLLGINFCHISLDRTEHVLMGADYGGAAIATFLLTPEGALGPAAYVIRHEGFNSVEPHRQDAPHVHSINTDSTNRYVLVCDFSKDEITVYNFQAATGELTPHSVCVTAPGSGPRHLAVHPDKDIVYVINELAGTVSVYSLDNGTLQELQTIPTLPAEYTGKNTAAEIRLSPDLRFLYGSNRGHDSIAHYRIDPDTGTLAFAAWTPTQGQHPRNFSIDPTGSFLIVANRDTDNVVVFKLDHATGTPRPTGQQITLSIPMGVQIGA